MLGVRIARAFGGGAGYFTYAMSYLVLSLFDPWVRFPPFVHVAAFVILLAWGAFAVMRLFRSGVNFSRARIVEMDIRLFPWIRAGLFGFLLIFGFYQAGDDLGRRLYVAATPAYLTPTPEMLLTVTLTPPAYTRLKPVVLARRVAIPDAHLFGSEAVRVPAGSVITVIAENTRWQPSLVWGREAINLRPRKAGGFRIAGKVTAGTAVEIRLGSKRLAAWPLQVTPDMAPKAEVTEGPGVTPRGLIKFHVVATDDYGVAYLALKMRLKDDAGGAERLVELPAYATPGIDEEEYVNLLSSPWAGKAVTMRVVALDGAGQEGSSASFQMTLPQFQFHDALSKELVAARALVLQGGEAIQQARDRLLTLVSGTMADNPDVTTYLGIRTAYLRLENDPTGQHAGEIADLLWDLAVRVEDGGMTSARDDLDQALDQLRFAVKRGASKADVSALAGRLAWAFRGYDDSRGKAGLDTGPDPDASAAKNRHGAGADRRGGLDWAALTKFLNKTVDLVNKGDYAQVAADLDALKAGFEERGDLLLTASVYRRFLVASYCHQILGVVLEGQQILLNRIGADIAAAGDDGKVNAGKLAADQQALALSLAKISGNLAKAGLGPYDALTASRKSMAVALAAIRKGRLEEAARAQRQALTDIDGIFKALAGVPSPVGSDWKGHAFDPLGRPLPDFLPALDTKAKYKPAP